MRITRIEITGTTMPGERTPQAVAELTRQHDGGRVEANVDFQTGFAEKLTFAASDEPAADRQQLEAARDLAMKLDSDEGDAEAILQAVTMMGLPGWPPAEPDDKEMLEETMRNTLSPEAVAAVAWGVRRTITNDRSVQRQLDWIATILENMVGGAVEHQKTCDELGLEH